MSSRLSSGLELFIVLVEVGVYLINVAIVLDCVLSELAKVGPEGCHSGVAVASLMIVLYTRGATTLGSPLTLTS